MGCVWPGSYKSFSLRLTHGARKVGRIRRRPATDGTALLFTNRRRAVVLSEWADALDALRSLPLIAGRDSSPPSRLGLPSSRPANHVGPSTADTPSSLLPAVDGPLDRDGSTV